MIHTGYQNADILTAGQCSIKTVRDDIGICNRDYETVAIKKGQSKHSNCIHTLEFIQQLQDEVIENLSKEMQTKWERWVLKSSPWSWP